MVSNRLHSPTKAQRAFAALIALCCTLLSTVASFQHTDCLLSDRADTPISRLASLSDVASPIAAALHAHSAHCSACEWQAVNVSPAMPAFVFASVSAFVPDTPAAPSHYRHLRGFSSSARAPPCA